MTGTTVSYYWDDTSLQSWHDFADSVLVDDATPTPVPTEQVPIESPTPDDASGQRPGFDATSTAEPEVSPTGVPDVTATPTPAGAGEPAPAFAAGPWRIAVRAVDLGETIDYLGLGYVDGNQWVVVYADVTNWSETDQQLDAASMTLSTASGNVAPDAVNTQSTASLLGLEPANGSTAQVPAGSSIRVALVYSIPVSETELILSVDGNQLPLEDAVGRQFDVTDLSTIATPPALLSGTLRVAPDNGSEQPVFVVDTDNGEVQVQLAGVDFTEDGRCSSIGGDPVEISVDSVPSQTVWLETDPAIAEADTYYVWLDDGAGGRVLLNVSLIANGLAFEGDLPEAARFGAWLEHAEQIARSNSEGIWQFCS